MLNCKITSSLVKCFTDESVESKPALTGISVLKNERLSFQFVYKEDDIKEPYRGFASVIISSPFENVTVRTVEQIISLMPVYRNAYDDNYLRSEPGLYPDVLIPTHYGLSAPVYPGELRSLWIECEAGSAEIGNHTVTVSLVRGADTLCTASFTVSVINAELPEQTLILTQWFHCDCLANYYNVPVFSKEHWRIIENYLKTAVKNGINTILTPIFTPPLDTSPGKERTTVQLVGVEVTPDGYKFDFSKLGRWVDMCERIGVRYYEISHLFTQWGAAHAPKIIADVNGEKKKIFGWETDSCGEEYRAFLSAFIPRLLAYLKRKGVADRCRFHISDEPSFEQLEHYKAAKSGVEKLLEGYPIMDALSNLEFYKTGVIKHPIPGCDHVDAFYEAGVPELWTYYCCGQNREVPNRFVAMPSARNRIIGFLFYKYDIRGFLQWGYNFYNNCGSNDAINPYISTTGDYFVPTGDTCSVWPAQNGEAYESLRICVFYDAIQDMRACMLCDSIYGREYTLSLLEGELDEPLTFKKYPHDDEYILKTRNRINEAIENSSK